MSALRALHFKNLTWLSSMDPLQNANTLALCKELLKFPGSNLDLYGNLVQGVHDANLGLTNLRDRTLASLKLA